MDKKESSPIGMYDDIAAETGMAMNTLREYKHISEAVKSDVRTSDLSFNHHKEVASLPPSGLTRFTRTEAMRSINIRRYQMRTFELCPSQRRRATCYSGSLKLTSNKGF